MTDEAWAVATDEKSGHTWEFIRLLGEYDKKRTFLPRFESEIGSRAGNWRFGNYCFGLYRADPAFVEAHLDVLSEKPGSDRSSLLKLIEFIGPTPTNRVRLLKYVADKSVSPADISEVIRVHWLDKLPQTEAAELMNYVAQGENWPEHTADVLSLNFGTEKPLPKELIPVGKRVLREIEPHYDNAYKCDHIALGMAKTDLESAFELMAEQVVTLNKVDWRGRRSMWIPFYHRGGPAFWDYLRTQDPERAYRSLCALKNRHVLENEIFYDNKMLLDLENHSPILLKIANGDESLAVQIAGAVSIKQPGFFTFAFDLLSGQPIDGKVADCLASSVIERFGSGTPLEKELAALRDVEAQLNNPEIPSHGRAWLEQLKLKIQEAIRTSPWNRGDDEPLGWS